MRDPSTGLFSRLYLEESLEREFARAFRAEAPLSIIQMSVDHFRDFTSGFGRRAGQSVLAALGGLMKVEFRAEDLVCRYGEQEFLCLLPGATLQQACHRAESFRVDIKQHVRSNDRARPAISLSIGVATFPDHGTTAEEVLHAAEAALREAKKLGRDRVIFLEPAPLHFVS